jgi:hypothetical protein
MELPGGAPGGNVVEGVLDVFGIAVVKFDVVCISSYVNVGDGIE